MSGVAKSNDTVDAIAVRNRELDPSVVRVEGLYEIEVIREGKTVFHNTFKNLITTEGLRYLLDASMVPTTVGNYTNTYVPQTGWYVKLTGRLAANPGTPLGDAAAAMTYAVPTSDGAEFVDYDEPTRPEWTCALHGSNPSLTNSASKAVFTIAAAATNAGFVEGAALVSRSTIGDTTSGDYMVSYSKFGQVITVIDNDIVNVTITVTLSAA